MAKKQKESVKIIENEKLCSILSYVLVGIIWFFVDDKIRKSEKVKFHVKQGMVLLIADLIAMVISGIFPIGFIGSQILYIFILILAIIGIINAANDSQKVLPLIGGLAEKFNF